MVSDGQDSLTGETALTVSACNGCHTVVTTLLSRGANVAVPNQKVRCEPSIASCSRL